MRARGSRQKSAMAEPREDAAASEERHARWLAALIKTAPQLVVAARQRSARVDEWLDEIARDAPPARRSKPLLAVEAAHASSRRCSTALADGSPYLWDWSAPIPSGLLALLEADPDAHFAALLAERRRAPALAAQGRSRGDARCCAA